MCGRQNKPRPGGVRALSLEDNASTRRVSSGEEVFASHQFFRRINFTHLPKHTMNKTMKLAVIAAGSTAACCAIAVMALSSGRDRSPAVRPEPAMVPQPVPEPHRVPDFRAQPSEETLSNAKALEDEIATEAAQQEERIQTAADLQRYLDQLEQRARRKGKVSALEIEPAVRVLSRMSPQLGPDEVIRLQNEFGARMSALSSELDPSVQPSDPMPTDPNVQNQGE